MNLISIILRLKANPIRTWSLGKGKYIPQLNSIEKWIKNNSSAKGIYVSNLDRKEYPEVTGYWIETALTWGFSDLASSWIMWLVKLQNIDGGWPDTSLNNQSLFFDSGQVVRGIKHYSDNKRINSSVIYKKYLKYFDENKNKHLIPNSREMEHITWRLINLQIASIVQKNWPKHLSKKWLVSNLKKYIDFWNVGYRSSHFDIYILEALYDLSIFTKELSKYIGYFDKIVTKYGLVTCDRNNIAPCYTASAQLGVLYYKMGRKEDGEKILFNLLDQLDISKGNWPGSTESGNYLVNQEISWGLKYFLDLLNLYSHHSFDLSKDGEWMKTDNSFHDILLKELISTLNIGDKVLDVGCGLGRYMDVLKDKYQVYGIDISSHNVKICRNKKLNVASGSLTNYNLPKQYPSKFNLIYMIEAFEHAVFPGNAIAQARLHLKDNGKLIIIDKDFYSCLDYRLCCFEQYFTKREYAKLALNNDMSILSFKKIGNFIMCTMVKKFK
jgi:SAM-dependent methyltransferase